MLSRARSLFRHCSIRGLFIRTEETPNVNSLKFKTGHTVMQEGVREFTKPAEAVVSPLADVLFHIDGVQSVFYGPDFITVSKDDRFAWDQLKPNIFAAIMDQYNIRGEELFDPAKEKTQAGPSAKTAAVSGEWPNDASPETVAMIRDILDTRIRPVVQQDGGDVEYRGFVNGYVRLRMQGACRSCASSVVTLRNGIENMLMHYVPEVLGVEQVTDEAEDVAEDEFRKFEEGRYPRHDDDDEHHHDDREKDNLLDTIKTKPRVK